MLRLLALVAAESHAPDHPAHQWFRDRYERVVAGVANAIRRDQDMGRISNSRDHHQIAQSLVALWDGLQLQWLAHRSPARPRGPDDSGAGGPAGHQGSHGTAAHLTGLSPRPPVAWAPGDAAPNAGVGFTRVGDRILFARPVLLLLGRALFGGGGAGGRLGVPAGEDA
ncbi:TetR family transcriptional regulator C-terminal domain-containing protein [Streptomyces sp. NPDC002144]